MYYVHYNLSLDAYIIRKRTRYNIVCTLSADICHVLFGCAAEAYNLFTCTVFQSNNNNDNN